MTFASYVLLSVLLFLDSFRDFYHFTDEQAKEATEKYRERFADTGIYENKLYDGKSTFLKRQPGKGAS